MTKALSLVARLELNGDKSKSAHVVSYQMGETATVITNKLPNAKAPDGKSSMTIAEGEPIEISGAEFDDLTPVGQCSNDKCCAHFYAIPESLTALSALATTDGLHCTVCASKINHDDSEDMVQAIAALETAGDDDADDNTDDDTSEEAADGGDDDDDSDDDGEETTTAADDDDSSEDDADDSASEEAADETAAKAKKPTQKATKHKTKVVEEDDDDDDDDSDDDDSDDDDDIDEEVEVLDDDEEEEASAADLDDDDGDDSNEEAALDGSILVDVTASVDFDERSLTLSRVTAGTIGVFASVDGAMTPLGTLEADRATASNQRYFATDSNLGSFAKVLIAATETASDLVDLGFKPIHVQVKVEDAIAASVAATKEQSSADVATQVASRVEDFKQCMAIAIAGMTKGMYDNPLVDSLTTRLSQRSIANADSVASRVVGDSLDDFGRAVITTTLALMEEPEAARNAVARTITGSKSGAVATASTEADVSNPTLMSTASLQFPMGAAPEQAAEKPAPRKFDRATLWPDQA